LRDESFFFEEFGFAKFFKKERFIPNDFLRTAEPSNRYK
jgi:hypothetical protein